MIPIYYNSSLQSYVREQILSAVAVIVKRGTLDNKGGDRSSVFADVTQLISSGDLTMVRQEKQNALN